MAADRIRAAVTIARRPARAQRPVVRDRSTGLFRQEETL